jgi:hypothetical protein
MPAFLIRYRLPDSSSVLTDEIITPSDWTPAQTANHFTAAFCKTATILDCWQEDQPADLHHNSKPFLPLAS